jgi:hypothetical protein
MQTAAARENRRRWAVDRGVVAVVPAEALVGEAGAGGATGVEVIESGAAATAWPVRSSAIDWQRWGI